MSIYDNFKKDETSTTKRYVAFAIAVFILAIFIGYNFMNIIKIIEILWVCVNLPIFILSYINFFTKIKIFKTVNSEKLFIEWCIGLFVSSTLIVSLAVVLHTAYQRGHF